MSDNTSATNLYGDGELPGDADLVAPAASSKSDETGSADAADSNDSSDRNADTNTEGNIDINLEDSGSTGSDAEIADGETFTGIDGGLDKGLSEHLDPDDDSELETGLSGNTVLPDGPGRDGGAPAAGTPLP